LDKPHVILGLGELLWDVLPEGPRLGGAPANFTVMAGRLGNHAVLLSKIGRDEFGCEALGRLEPLPVDTSFVETDPGHVTGQVTVEFADGQPHYTIHHPAAWDFLDLTDEWLRLAERADALCFGSLAQRSPQSRQTIQTLAAQAPAKCIRVFDVNLRAPFYSAEVIEESLELATVFKMNDAEVSLVMDLLGLNQSLAMDGPQPGKGPSTDRELTRDQERQSAGRLLSEFPNLNMIAITRGGNGSLLVTRDEWHEHPGLPVEVADTIGAGDAFTAALTHYLLRGARLSTLNEAGNRWGGWVASQSGAMPPLPDDVKAKIESAIGT
jgi:fructokinase